MNWEKFKIFFHPSWHKKLRPFIESTECDEIYKFLKDEVRRGKKLAPSSSNTFRCFLETPLNDLKIIMLGMCPYHSFKDDKPIADGLLMSCSITGYPQPSLIKFYDAIEGELYEGLNLNSFRNPDLSYLAHQGVLLLNAALTVEYNVPGTHLKCWEPFMKYLFENVLDTAGVPVILLGENAKKCVKYISPFTNIFSVSHPASAAYGNKYWDPNGLFKDVNKILMDNNGYTINWLDIKESDDLPF